MPTYHVTDTQTGKSVSLTGDSPPTEEELTQIFGSLHQGTSPSPAAADPPSGLDRVASTLIDLGEGAIKGAGNTITGLGNMLRKVPGVNALDRIVAPVTFSTTPENTAQKVGYFGEQLGEYFVPVAGVAGKAAKVADVAKSGILAMAQSGSPTQGVISAGLTAVLPGAGAVKKASGALERSADKSMVQALGATKEWAKVESAKLAPQMLQRGVGGTRAAMLDLAKGTASKIGANLDDAYKAAAAAGETVPSAVIQGNIQLAADVLKVPDATGVMRVVPGTERVVQTLDDLATWTASLGDQIPVDTAAKIKKTWDHVVSKAGLFGPKAASTATDSADAWALREAAGSFRDLLNTNPDIAALNQEWAFWGSLRNVLKETTKRTQAQRGGLTDAIRGGAGAMAGAAMGGPLGAGAGGIATQTLSKALNSPWWKTEAAGPFKSALAHALASQNAGEIASVTSRILAALPAQYRSAP